MRKTSLLRKLLIAGRYLFVFRKPFLKELDFIDLLVEDKALFLLTWKQEYGYKVRIRQSRSTFYGRESGVVLLLGNAVHEVDVSFSNLWRKQKISIALKHTQFDAETKAYLLNQIRTVKKNGEVLWNTPLNQLEIHPIAITIRKPSTILRNTYPQPNVPTPLFNKKIAIQSDKLKYQ